MNSMLDTLQEYEAGCGGIRARIEELTEEITRRKGDGAVSAIRELEGRRRRLYEELNHMEESLRDMREYLALAKRA